MQEHSHTGVIEAPDKVHELTAETLKAIAGDDTPDTVKVFNLLKAIENMVRLRAADDPYLLEIGDKANAIAMAFEERQETTKKALEALERLIAELREAEKQRDETELSAEAFAVYWLLQREGIAQAGAVARAAAEAFVRHPHWATSSHQEQEVRKALYKALIRCGPR